VTVLVQVEVASHLYDEEVEEANRGVGGHPRIGNEGALGSSPSFGEVGMVVGTANPHVCVEAACGISTDGGVASGSGVFDAWDRRAQSQSRTSCYRTLKSPSPNPNRMLSLSLRSLLQA
jgi:hypothetical protein